MTAPSRAIGAGARRSSAICPTKEPQYPGWYSDRDAVRHGHYHRTCLDRTGLPYVLEQDADYARRDGLPCPLCVRRDAEAVPSATRVSPPLDAPRYPGWARVGSGTLWGTFHIACLSHATNGYAVLQSPDRAEPAGAACPLCPSLSQ